ncbi:MAG: DUF1849 family protein [Alphaproteobacteria bacterium]|nr:DUF1849 family protein [Alphaproteobacteria bacterium]
MVRSLVCFVAIVQVLGMLPFATQARSENTVDLVPHKATYEMRLGRVRAGGDVAGAKGTMTMETEKSCEGWALKHRFQLTLVNTEGNRIETESNFSSFESLDGMTYRFTARTTRDGAVTEDIQGNASLTAEGGGGHADFSRPKGTRFDLPKGTIFPTTHVRHLIAGARNGKNRVFRVVFDGQSKEGALEVNAVILGLQQEAVGKWAKDPLTRRPSWHMRLAFFALASSKAEPQHEAGLRVFDNGVADDFEWDWGTFTVKGNLTSLEELPGPTC